MYRRDLSDDSYMNNQAYFSALLKSGMCESELAAKINVTPKTIRGWRNNEHQPRSYNMRKLCDVLGVEMDVLFPIHERRSAANPHCPTREKVLLGFFRQHKYLRRRS